MRAYRLLQRICKLLARCVMNGIDYVSYVVSEVKNSDRNTGWKEDEMTELMTAQQGTREELALAHDRREFWKRLMEEGSNGSASDTPGGTGVATP